MNNCAATPKNEIEAMKTQCWEPKCGRRAFLSDYAGWQWCFRGWRRSFQDKDTWRSKWHFLKTTRIFLRQAN